MNQITNQVLVIDPKGGGHSRDIETGDEDFKPLSHDEAEALRRRLPQLSPWRVVGMQAVAGLLCTGIVWGVMGTERMAASALFGAVAVVLPQAVLARGMSKPLNMNAGAAVFGFMFWEMAKIACTVALLVIAAKVVPNLSWPALLVTMVVCMKVSWLALLTRRPADRRQRQRERD